MKKQFTPYKSRYKGNQGLKENRQKKLLSIVESLKKCKRKLKEEDGEGVEDLTDTDLKDTANPDAIAKIIDDVEGLVINAIQTLGATDSVTTELIGTAGTLETLQDEEEMIADIDASAKEAYVIQEEFEPVYDPMGNIINYSQEDSLIDDSFGDDDDFSDEVYDNEFDDSYEDGLMVDNDFDMMDNFSDEDEYGNVYESYSKRKQKNSGKTIKTKFRKKSY